MKNLLNITILMLIIQAVLSGCKKENQDILAASSFTIVNGIAGSTPLVTNFYNDSKLIYYRTAQQIAAYGFVRYSGYQGDYHLGIYRLADTTKVQYLSNLTLEPNSIKTLFLTGTVSETEGFLVSERIPSYSQQDSLVGIRFVNLSKGSGALNVVLRSASKNVATGLEYKGITSFQTVSAKYKDPVSYVFDFKDAVTNATLSSYTLSSLTTLLSKNVTIAFRGIRGGTGTSAVGTFLVSHY